jgi:hypothetical protein
MEKNPCIKDVNSISPEFMEMENLLPCLQELAFGDYPDSAEFRPNPLQLRTILILISRLCLNTLSVILHSAF